MNNRLHANEAMFYRSSGTPMGVTASHPGQVSSADGTKPYGKFFSYPAERFKAASPGIALRERSSFSPTICWCSGRYLNRA